MKKILLSLVVCGLLGCPPMPKPRSMQQIEAGYIVDKNKKELLETNQAVDAFEKKVTQVMKENGFVLNYTGHTWIVLPWIGRKKNLYYRMQDRDISCFIKVSKSKFIVDFKEYKTYSGNYIATDADRALVKKTAQALNELAQKEFKGRSIKISTYDFSRE